MRKYAFFDTDPSGMAEYDIAGENYEKLIHCCCQYCSSVALLVDNSRVTQMRILTDLEQYRIPTTPEIESMYFGEYGHYGHQGSNPLYEVRHYTLCPAVEGILLHSAHSIFSWLCGWGFTNPADPTFFRKDGSVFLSSVIHEGECRLFAEETENVDMVVAEAGWMKQ